MIEEKALSEAARALGLKELVPVVYKDLFSPAAKEWGEGLLIVAKTVNMCLAPVEATVWGYERIREWLSVKVTNLLAERRAENIQSPPLSVAGPLVMQMVFASEEPDLREMYARLLATSMDCATASDAHPSFVTVIQQLTPDEAKLLRHIASLSKNSPFRKAIIRERYRAPPELVSIEAAMRKVCVDAGLSLPDRADMYVDNLIRLRVLKSDTTSDVGFIASADIYSSDVATIYTDSIELTLYGSTLLRACVDTTTREQKEETPM